MKYKVTLNGKTYEIEVEHGQAMLLDEYTAVTAPAAPAAPVAAPAAPVAAAPAPAAAPAFAGGTPGGTPLPGTILDVKVRVGDAVKAGQLVAILEAMKMENEIFAPCDGTVAQVAVSRGSAVDTGTVLLVLS